MKRVGCLLLMVAALLFGLGLSAYAEENTPSSEGKPLYDYHSLLDALPEEFQAMLPEGLENCTDEQEIAAQFDSAYWGGLCTALLQKGLTAGLKLFATLLGLILLSAILSRCGELFLKERSPIIEYALLIITALEIYGILYSLFDLTRTYIGQINDYMTGISASLSAIFLLSANVGTAALQSVWFSLLLTVSEKISYHLLLPMLQMSFAMTLVSALCTDMNLRSVTDFIRKLCTGLLVGTMTLITVLMSFQTGIASAADSLGMRSVKFAASNAIPIIGGLVSDTFRTLASSLALIRSTAGFLCVAGLLLCTLTPLCMLFTCRYSLSLAGVAAELLGADTVRAFLEEAGKLVSFLIAVLLIFSIFYLFTLALLIHTASAIG